MKGLLNECIEKIQRSRKKVRRYRMTMLVLAALTVFGVNWGLHQNGITMSGEYVCGYEQGHLHSEECYADVLVCGETEGEEHTHSEICHQRQLFCVLPEHVHTDACLAPVEEAAPEEAAEPAVNAEKPAPEETGSEETAAPSAETEAAPSEELAETAGDAEEPASENGTETSADTEEPVSGEMSETSDTAEELASEDMTETSADTEEPASEDMTETSADTEEPVSDDMTETSADAGEPVSEKMSETADEEEETASEELTEPSSDETENNANDANGLEDGSVDLKDIENKTIVVKKKNNKGAYVEVEEGEALTSGDDIAIDITFTTTADTFKDVDDAIVTYQLPNGILLTEALTGDIKSTDGTEVMGTYTIETDGRVTMHFYKEKINKDQKFTATLEFTGRASYSGTGDKETFKFDGTDTTITVQKKADIDIKKSLVSEEPTVIGEDKYYHFQVKVSTENGTLETVNIGDKILTNDKEYKISGSYVEEPLSDAGITAPKLTRRAADGSESAVDAAITMDNKDKKMSIKELPKLEAGESYVLDYWVKLDESGNDSMDGSGKFRNNAYANIDNKMQDTDEKKIEIKGGKPGIEKSGSYENGVVTWTVKVKNPGHDLNGYTVTDALSESGVAQTIIGKINLTGYTDGAPGVSTEVPANEDGKGFTYTFGEGMTADYYTFTYQTAVDTSEESGTAGNTAYLIEKGETKGEAEGEVEVSTGDIEKRFLRADQAGDLKYLRWRITASNLSDGWQTVTLKDVIQQPTMKNFDNTGIDAHYAVYAEVKAELENGDAWTFYKTDGSTMNLEMARALGITLEVRYYTDEAGTIEAVNDSDHVHCIVMTVKKGSYDTAVSGEIGKIILNEGDDYAHKYHTVLDVSVLTKAGEYEIPNSVTLDGEKTSTAEMPYGHTVSLAKLASAADPGEGVKGDYSDSGVKIPYSEEGDTLIYYMVNLDWKKGSSDSVAVTDTLPEGVVYVEGKTTYAQFKSGTDHYYSAEGENKEFNISEHLTAVYDEASRTVIFTISGLNSVTEWDNNFSGLAIRYAVKVTDEYWSGWDKDRIRKTYQNTVRWNGNETSNSVEVERSEKSITKTSALDKETNEISYTIEINPYGRTFSDGNGNALKSLILKDDLTIPVRVSASLERDSITLTDEDGNAETDYTFKDSEELTDGNRIYHMELSVPNGKHLTLRYTYKINRDGADGMEGFDVSNTAELNGESSGEKKVKLDTNSSSADVKQTSLTIYKVDSEHTNLTLPGAEFELSVYNTETGQFERINDSEKYVSDEDGKIALTYQSSRLKPEENAASAFRANALYRLTETTAPTGYVKRTEPIYFIWYESSESRKDAYQEATGGAGIEGVSFENVDFFLTLVKSDLIIGNEKEKEISYELPKTGGMGVTAFYAAGLILMMGAAAERLIRRKKPVNMKKS